MKTLITLSLQFISIGLLSVTTATHAHHAWNDFHWASAFKPMAIPVINSVSEEWLYQLDAALQYWSQSIDLDPYVAEIDNSAKTQLKCPLTQGYLRVCNNNYGITGWFGQTVVGFDQFGHINKARVRLNDSYSQYWNLIKKNHIMCHELGHSVGLWHTSQDSSSQQSCMDLSNDPLSQWPNQHDYSQLIAIYAHQDFYSSFAFGSALIPRPIVNAVPDTVNGTLVEKNPNFEIWQVYSDTGETLLIHNYLMPTTFN